MGGKEEEAAEAEADVVVSLAHTHTHYAVNKLTSPKGTQRSRARRATGRGRSPSTQRAECATKVRVPTAALQKRCNESEERRRVCEQSRGSERSNHATAARKASVVHAPLSAAHASPAAAAQLAPPSVTDSPPPVASTIAATAPNAGSRRSIASEAPRHQNSDGARQHALVTPKSVLKRRCTARSGEIPRDPTSATSCVV